MCVKMLYIIERPVKAKLIYKHESTLKMFVCYWWQDEMEYNWNISIKLNGGMVVV